jgi:hypothetical protein
MHRLIHKWDVVRTKQDTHDASALLFVGLKPVEPLGEPQAASAGMNLGLLVARASGELDLYDITGMLLYRHLLGFSAQFLASTPGYDEIRILAGSTQQAVLLRLDMARPAKDVTAPHVETGAQVASLNVTMTFDTELSVQTPLCALQHYVKHGHKYWVLADCLGGLQLLAFNGTLLTSTQLDKPFLKLERFGQQLTFLSESSVGHVLTDQLKPTQICQLHGRTLDMAIDTTVSISQLHVLLESGELYVIDTADDCKRVARHFSVQVTPVSRVLSLRGATLVWTGAHILYFDRADGEPQVLPLQGGKGLLTSHRSQTGSIFIAVDTLQGVRLYEYVTPHLKAGLLGQSQSPLVYLLVLGVGLGLLWLCTRKNSVKIKTE